MPDLAILLDAAADLGRAAWPAVWRPLLLWTAGAVIVEGGLRLIHALPALVRYRVRQTVLAALPAGLLSSLVIDMPLGTSPVPAMAALDPSRITLPAVTVAPGAEIDVSAVAVLGLVTAGAVVAAVVQLGRLGIEAVRLHHFRRHATSAPRSGELMERLSLLARRAGVARYALPVRTTQGDVPMLLPGRPPLIVLPTWMADGETRPERLDMALVHELVHLDRYDDVAAMLEQVVAALAAGLPPVRLLVRQIAVDREAACDRRVIDLLRCQRGTYARLLTDVATKSPGVPAVALSESPSSLEQRLRMMTHDSFSSPSPRLLRTLSGGLLVLLVTAIVACSTDSTDANLTASEPPEKTERTDDAQKPPAPPRMTSTDDVYVVTKEFPTLIGGLRAVQEKLRYPDEAASAGEEGRVFVTFIVTTDGNVANARVTKNVSPALDAEALRVVRQMEFEPGRHEGKKVKVQMSLPVTFRLPDDGSDPA